MKLNDVKLAIALAALLHGANAGRAQEEAVTTKQNSATREALGILQETIDLDQEKYQNPMTVKEAVGLLRGELAKGKRLRIFVDTEAYKEENPDAPDVWDTQVKFAGHQGRVPLGVALRMAIAKIPTNNAALLVRRGQIEVTTKERAMLAALLREPVTAVFENQPLQEILQELADQTGATILLDPSGQGQAKTSLSATLRGTITLESAVGALVKMADLRAVIDDDILVVTGKQAEPREETEFDFKKRRVDVVLRELAETTGKTIILDPKIANKIRAGESLTRLPERLGLPGVGPSPLPVDEGPVPEKYAVTATFRKKISLENMVRIVAAMVDLSVVVLDDAIYVSDAAGVSRLQVQLDRKDYRGHSVKPK